MARFLAVLAFMAAYLVGGVWAIDALDPAPFWAVLLNIALGGIGLPVALLAIEASLMFVRETPDAG